MAVRVLPEFHAVFCARSPVVEHLVVVDELDVAGREVHFEMDQRIVRDLIERVERGDLAVEPELAGRRGRGAFASETFERRGRRPRPYITPRGTITMSCQPLSLAWRITKAMRSWASWVCISGGGANRRL
jgi:hypothetical protein